MSEVCNETDGKVDDVTSAFPTREEFYSWTQARGETTLRCLLNGYAAIHATRQRVMNDGVIDPEGIIEGVIWRAEDEIEDDIILLFREAFQHFCVEKKKGRAN